MPRQIKGSDIVTAIGGGQAGQILTSAGDPNVPTWQDYSVSAFNVRGKYNAANNTPLISSNGGGGLDRDIFLVSVAGTVAADGIGNAAVNDQILHSGGTWQLIQTSSLFGTMAPQNSNNVAITGGNINGLSQVGFSDGTVAKAVDARVPVTPYLYMWSDSGGNVLSGYRVTDGWFETYGLHALFQSVDTQTITGTSTINGSLVCGGSALTQIDPRVTGYLWSFLDGAGNAFIAIRDDGTFMAANVVVTFGTIGTLTVTGALILTGSFAPSAITVSNRTDSLLDLRVPDVAEVEADNTGAANTIKKNDGFVVFKPARGVVNKVVQRMVRRDNIMTMGPPNGSTSEAADTSGTTYHQLVSLDTNGFDAVRLVYQNTQQTGTCTIKGCVAATASLTDRVNPTGAWVPVTFNNNGLPVDLDKQAVSILRNEVSVPAKTTSFTMPLATLLTDTTISNAIFVSDWVPLSSIDRTDVTSGYAWPLLMIRTYATGAPFPSVLLNSNFAQAGKMDWAGMLAGNRVWDASSVVGDFVTTQDNYALPALNGSIMVVAVQYYSRSKGITTVSIGDSVAGGTGAQAGVGYHVRAAYALSTPSLPVTSFNPPNAGVAGTSPYRYWNAAINFYHVAPYQVAWMETSSRNWAYDQIHTDYNWQMCMQLQETLEKAGGQGIFVAPQPNASMTTLTEPFRVEAVTRCSQIEVGGGLVIDPNPIVGLGTFPDAMKTFYSNDNLHLNDRGHDMMAALSIPLLKDAIGII